MLGITLAARSTPSSPQPPQHLRLRAQAGVIRFDLDDPYDLL
jgi:hypothetical protein